MLQSQEPIVEQDLQIAPPPDPNPIIPKLIIAGVVMIIIVVAVYMLNPRKTAVITVVKTDVFAPHTEFSRCPAAARSSVCPHSPRTMSMSSPP